MKANSDIKTFKNKFKNKRCFIVGNGPSLNVTDLELIKDEYSFGMNRIALLYNEFSWRPTFYICTTTNIYRPEWEKDIFKSIDLGITSFVWDKFTDLVKPRKSIYYLNCTEGKKVTKKAQRKWWSDDISKKICKFGTSMIVAFQIAFYMGFDPIYIVGADLGYSDEKLSLLNKTLRYFNIKTKSKDTNHFSEKYGTPGLRAADLNSNMLAAHRLTYRVSKEKRVKIYNATIGGQLEIYPRVDYNSLFNKND